ncbi:MAG: DNA replication and repair protein RecF [Thermoleophilia bacterium]|nr:DNA replication and repair protein RecF [Thermoleophilia bacterium]
MTETWRARAVRVTDLRCWARAQIDLEPGLVVIWGPNGAGKTSLVEALTMGCLGVSPRSSREAEIVRRGAEAARVEVSLDGPGGRRERAIGYAPLRGRRMSIDDAPVRALGEWAVPGAVLVFIPDELRIVKGPPAARRRHLDRLLEASRSGYRESSSGYKHAISQRNALLRRVRSGEVSATELTPWERQMIPLAAEIIRARRQAIVDLGEPFRHWFEALGGGDEGALRLDPSPSALRGVPGEDLERVLLEMMDERRPRDIAAAQTLSGPHRDDVGLWAGELDLRSSGSQGEQRTAALALTLAHRDHLSEVVARPILLLDDALSELDPDRRARLLEAVADSGQTLITTADPAVAELARAVSAQVLHVEAGDVAVG